MSTNQIPLRKPACILPLAHRLSGSALTLLIVEPCPLMAMALAALLLPLAPGSLMAVTTPELLLHSLNLASYDIVMMDIVGPDRCSSLAPLNTVLHRRPRPKVLIYSADTHPCVVRAAMDAGAHAYLARTSDPDRLSEAYLRVIRSELYVDPAIDLSKADQHLWRQLTLCERDVLVGLAKGRSLQQLAIETGRSYKTVTAHKYNAMHKLHLTSRAEISSYLGREGLGYLIV